MLRLTVLERGEICRDLKVLPHSSGSDFGTPERRLIPSVLYDRLIAAESAREGKGEKPIFSWHHNRAFVGPWVGVLQIPGLQLEILPKLDNQPQQINGDVSLVRNNLMYMLQYAGITSMRERGMANSAVRKGTIYDALCERFLSALVTELRRGVVRQYIPEEETLLTVRGRLVISKQLTVNAAAKHRFYCAFETLVEDTPMNRIFRSACNVLRHWKLSPAAQRQLAEVEMWLEGVQPLPDRAPLPTVAFNRQNERFRDTHDFAWLLLNGLAPDAKAGPNRTFALLFDMDKVFEGYIAAVLQREVVPKFNGLSLAPQARRQTEYLFQPDEGDPAGKNALRLKPDLLFTWTQGANNQHFVMDTKWKRLDANGTPGNNDLYQLYAYLHRFGCKRACFLYPLAAGSKQRTFDALGPDRKSIGQVTTEFVDLRQSLANKEGREKVIVELQRILESARKVSLGELTAAEPVVATT